MSKKVMDQQKGWIDAWYPVLLDRRLLPHVPEFVEDRNGQFCIALSFEPSFIAEVCRHGYIPMGEIARGRQILLIKSHQQRCILNFENLHISRKLKRYARDLTLRINHNFETCLQQTVNSHENNWLIKPLCNAFTKIHYQEMFSVKLHSIEIYADETLVAGEIGYTTGSIYTSLSGFHTQNGSGSVQLAVLGKILSESGFTFWDLGMDMIYKRTLGAHSIDRPSFLELWHQKAQAKTPQWSAKDLSSEQMIQLLKRQ